MYENLKSQILHLLQKDATPRTRALLSQELGLSAEWRNELNVALNELSAAGQLVLGPGNQVRLPSLSQEVIGTFHAHARGFGFVTPQQATAEGEVFIPAKAMGNAMTGDRVLAQIVRKQSSHDPDRISGKIVKVLERAHSTIVGTLRWEAGTWVVYPDGANFQREQARLIIQVYRICRADLHTFATLIAVRALVDDIGIRDSSGSDFISGFAFGHTLLVVIR